MNTDEKLTIIKSWTQRCEVLPKETVAQFGCSFGHIGWFSVMDINQHTTMMETKTHDSPAAVVDEMLSIVRGMIIVLVAQVEKDK